MDMIEQYLNRIAFALEDQVDLARASLEISRAVLEVQMKSAEGNERLAKAFEEMDDAESRLQEE